MPRAHAQPSGSGSIVGRIVDNAGDPLGDVDVMLYVKNSDGAWTWTNLYLTTLPDDGRFLFASLAAGDYALQFSDNQGRYLPGYYNGKASREEADPILLAGDAVDLHDISLTPAARIGGHVRQRDETPQANIAVTLYAEAPGAPAGWAPLAYDLTEDDGAYYFGALLAGIYRVGYVDTATPPLFASGFYTPNLHTLADATDIVVALGEFRDKVDVTLVPFAAITGIVTLPSGAGLGDVYGCLRVARAPPPPSGLWLTTDCIAYNRTDADGHYAITGLQGGEYEMQFFDLEWPPRYFDAPYSHAPGGVTPDLIHLAEEQQLADVDVVLRPAGYIAGTAKAPDGSVLENVDVRLYRPGAAGWWWFQSARTDEAGHYAFQTMVPVTYTVGFFDPQGRYAPDYHASAETLIDATSIITADGPYHPNIDGQLRIGGSVNGGITAGGAALAGAEVGLYLRGTEWLTQTTTDAFGAFAFSGLGLETHTFYARDTAGEYTPASSAPFTVAAGGTLSLPDIDLLPAPTLTPTTLVTTTGHVSTTEGAPISGTVVTLYKVPGLRARAAMWDAEPFTCASAASLEEGAPLSDAAPAVGAVFAYPAAEGLDPAMNPQLTNDSGAFGWVLPPGCWFVRVDAGYASGVSAVAGAPPRIANLDVVLPPPPTPTPAPTQTPTIAPTLTKAPPPAPTATRTAAPTATRTPPPNPTATGVATVAPTASATSTSTSTATSTAAATPAPSPGTPTPGGVSTPDAVTPTPNMRVLLPVVQK